MFGVTGKWMKSICQLAEDNSSLFKKIRMNAYKSNHQLLKRVLEEQQDNDNYNISNCNWTKKENKDLTEKEKKTLHQSQSVKN